MPLLAQEYVRFLRSTSQPVSQLDPNPERFCRGWRAQSARSPPEYHEGYARSSAPSEHTQGGLLDFTPQHLVQAIARRDVNGNFQFIFKKLLDADQVQRVKFGAWIIVDEEVEVAGLLGLVVHGRTKEIKRCSAHRPDRRGVIFQF